MLYNYKKYTLQSQSLPWLVNYFPKYSQDRDPKNFAQVKLILHYPFRAITNLLSFDSYDFED